MKLTLKAGDEVRKLYTNTVKRVVQITMLKPVESKIAIFNDGTWEYTHRLYLIARDGKEI